jgi:hypothetical protein
MTSSHTQRRVLWGARGGRSFDRHMTRRHCRDRVAAARADDLAPEGCTALVLGTGLRIASYGELFVEMPLPSFSFEPWRAPRSGAGPKVRRVSGDT